MGRVEVDGISKYGPPPARIIIAIPQNYGVAVLNHGSGGHLCQALVTNVKTIELLVTIGTWGFNINRCVGTMPLAK